MHERLQPRRYGSCSGSKFALGAEECVDNPPFTD
jgi:hypothetical protein